MGLWSLVHGGSVLESMVRYVATMLLHKFCGVEVMEFVGWGLVV